MKITKAQKEAIVNEISRRLKKENQILTENFNKNYKFTEEEKEFLSICKETEEINKKWEIAADKANNLANKLGYNTSYNWKSDEAKNRILRDRLIKSNQLKSVDSCIIRDKLEFATLDPSFDVEEFIKKFI